MHSTARPPVTLKLDAEEVAASAELNKTSTVVKRFVVDYTSETLVQS